MLANMRLLYSVKSLHWHAIMVVPAWPDYILMYSSATGRSLACDT